MEEFPSLAQPRGVKMLQHFLSNFRSIICQLAAYGRSKTKQLFKLLALKNGGGGRLREVVVYKNFQI